MYVCVCVYKWDPTMYFVLQLFFGLTAQLAGSQFPDQGLNPGHGSESLES